MKKLLYTTALSALLIAGAGCSKSKLNLLPFNQLATSAAFANQADFTYAVNGMYQGLRASGSYFDGTWNIIADVLGDNLIINPTGRQSLKSYYIYTYTSSATYGLFSGGYTITRRANAILENIGNLPAGTFKNDVQGQALALRAMTYFDMARVYSKTYLNASDADFTLPYVTTTAATNLPASEPLKGFYDKVIADLVAAEALINPLATNKDIYLNKEAVAGLLSRVYLYKGDYANCIAQANIALGATPNLPSVTTFPSIWTDATESGVLFKVKNTTIDNLNNLGVNYYQYTPPPAGNPTGNGYKSEYLPDFGLYSSYDATDVRKSSYFLTFYYNGALENHIIKYAGRSGPPISATGVVNTNTTNPAGVVDGKALRTAEVLLNRMEAEYRSGATGPALADLVLLKTNRYTGYAGSAIATADAALSGAGLLNEILLQRRLELAFEGDRFFDLKRLNLPVARTNKGEKADGSGTLPLSLGIPAGDYRFQLPYPQSEILFNPNIKQNPGAY
ncbi:MAG TPA: RagB/SusD family nutrient uptake outer membrane protein [Mucilaginibacter sp.]|nr:RagB/SusD family nutrient uptake outer membrane protein [Mucilaginibacter sp.]